MSDAKAAAQEHAVIGATAHTDGSHTQHPDAQWFGEAGLGVFYHWGIASTFGNTDLSWGMIQDFRWDEPVPGYPKVTPEQYYREGMANFHPEHYDPRKWIAAAKEAGARYAVLTTKHHDGYTLWPSKYTEIGVGQSLGGRDLVAPFVEACREYGLKVGLYYSPPDWYFNRNYMSFNADTMSPSKPGPYKDFYLRPMEQWPVMPAEHKKAFSEHIRRQTLELLTNYGKIDVIWFDGRGVEPDDPDPITIEEIRALQPGIVINPRMHGKGDFSTPECQIPETAPEGWWEVCHLINDHGWGYTVHPYKSFDWILQTLLKIRSLGGNFLANAGPMPDGRMPEQYYERMKQLAEWMKTGRSQIFND